MAITLIASVSSTAVACARGPKMQTIQTKFNENKVGDTTYTEGELWTAFNGSNSTLYGTLSPMKALSRHILNLLGFNQTLVTQKKLIPRYREFYIGNDVIENGNVLSAPSVDGIFYGSEVIEMAQDAFYNQYEKTQISSIAGLYGLYQYNQTTPGKITSTGAQTSLAVIQNSFANNPTASQEFINSFLGLDDKNYDSAWMSQRYNFGENADLSTLKLDSFVTPFDQTVTTEDGKTTDKLTLSGEKNIGVPVNFPDLNTSIEKTPDAKIGNNKSEPFNLLLLPPVNTADIKDSSADATFNLGWSYDKEKVDGSKVWDMRKSSDGWQFNATEAVISEANAVKTQIGFIKTNESVVVPLKPLQIQYEYSTNVRDSGAPKFIINVTIDGVNAIFNPVTLSTNFKNAEEDSKNLGNRFIKWQFSHYQFNDVNNVYSIVGAKKTNEAGNGYFSGLKITDMTIQNA